MAITQCDQPNDISRPCMLWVLVAVVIVASRPLQSVDLLWDLSRGREVVHGTLRPCQTILTIDHASEANWLGGVPFWLCWRSSGIVGLCAIPLATGLILALGITRSTAEPRRVQLVAWLLPLLLLAARPDLEPAGPLYDLLGLAGLSWLLQQRATVPSQALLAGSLMCLWSNLGPRPIFGLLLALAWASPMKISPRVITAMLVGGSLTPRGLSTWVDSAILFAPQAWRPQWQLLDPDWRIAFDTPWTTELVAGSVLWLVVILQVGTQSHRNVRLPIVGRLLIPFAAAVLARGNLAPAALWTMLEWRQWTRTESGLVRPHGLWRMAPWLAVGALLAEGLIGTSPQSRKLGWGISQAIDPRLFTLGDAVAAGERLNAWCFDRRSCSVATWSDARIHVVDHPTRALLGNRLGVHAQILSDLRGARRSRYRRDNGSWGGWGEVLAQWNVNVLLIPAEEGRLHTSLLETPWKLLKLDCPTVPYGFAEHEALDRAILNVAIEQTFVETGEWQPTRDIYDSLGWRFDAARLFGVDPDVAAGSRQSAFFRAIGLPMAAVRTLLPLRLNGLPHDLLSEFTTCQQDLAAEELKVSGEVSRFRRSVMNQLAQHSAPAGDRGEAAASYVDGRLVEAARRLTPEDADGLYARAVILIELGESTEAEPLLRRAIETSDPGSAVGIMSAHCLSRLTSEAPRLSR